jgi:hypothetical protein
MPQKSFLDSNLKFRWGRLTLRGFYHPNAGKMTPEKSLPEKMTPRRCWVEAGGVGQWRAAMALVCGFDLCIGGVVALYNMSSKSGGCVTIFLVCNLHMW